MTQEMRWIDPHAGFEYQIDTVSIDDDYQSEKLQACGLDPALFGHSVDPSFYIGLGSTSGLTALNPLRSRRR
ncbi:MAG: hypothetical protein ACC642_04275 [Pseudomonadales bacterium]